MSHAARHDWTLAEVRDLLNRPFSDLIHQAQTIHRACHDPNQVQVSTLLSIKTGGCPEDCAYCPQSAHYQTGLDRGKTAGSGGGSRGCPPCGRQRRDPILPRRSLALADRPRLGRRGANDRSGARTGTRDLRDAGDAESGTGKTSRGLRVSTTTTTTWIPHRSSTARSSPPGPTKTAWTRCNMSATPVFGCAVAAFLGWANLGKIGPGF